MWERRHLDSRPALTAFALALGPPDVAALQDYCPARVTPLPPGVPAGRQLRGLVAGDTLTVMWLDAGARVQLVRMPAADYRVRQVGCRCTANPRLTAALV